MTNLSIKDVPEELAEALRCRAADNHRSLQGELMAILQQALQAASVPASQRPAAGALEGRRGTRLIEDIAAARRARYPEPVRGGKLNFHGTLYGGTLMRWIEGCAAMSACAFVDGPTRLRGVHGLAFLAPVVSNVFVHLSAKVAHAGPRISIAFRHGMDARVYG